MSTVFVDPMMSAALWITIKASALLGSAAIVQALLYRRTSAAMRHLIWTFAMVGALLLPMLSFALPGWVVVTHTQAPGVANTAPAIERVEESVTTPEMSAPLPRSDASSSSTRLPANISWSTVIVTVYVAGLFGMLIQLTTQTSSIRRLLREATEVRDPEWTRLLSESASSMAVHRLVRLLRSRVRSMPMAFGIRRPTILIPAVADTWPEDRRRAVIMHELAHVARHDCLTQSVAFAACTMYWFHPAAWWIARRLRIEREVACDDRVIMAGAEAHEYAGHLLEIAYTFGGYRAPALAPSMARPQQLEGRMLALLDVARKRSLPALRARVTGAVIAAVLVLPLASATSTVVAIEPDRDRPLRAAAPLSAPQEVPVLAPVLKPVDWPLIASARRIVRAAAAAIGVAQSLPGTWEIRPTNTKGTVHLRLVELNSSFSSDIPIQRLEGLTAAQLTGAGGPVQFRLRRDAGTFAFEGVVRSGVGAGTFSFVPDPSFPAELAKRGFARPTALEQYEMAWDDVGYAFLDELNKQGYVRPPTSGLVRAGQHGVDVTYLREMGALGYRLGSLDPLITLRDHDVAPVYIRALADRGYKSLSPEDLRRARDHDVSPEYIQALGDAGYVSLAIEQLIDARDHRVGPELLRGLDAAGYRQLPLDQLIRVRDHDVSPAYVREMRQLGYAIPIEELIRARDHDVDVKFVRGMAALGYEKLSMNSLIRLRDHDVSPKYAQDLKALGYDGLAVEDLVTLRDHDLTPDRIRSANARARTRLPIDMLKRFAAGGT